MEHVIVVGAGPCGLSAAIELKKRGIEALVIEKGCLVNSIYGFPTQMRFFSTADLLEIGDVPFIVPQDKPTREEALHYYRQVASRYQLRIHTYEKVEAIQREAGRFTVRTVTAKGRQNRYECQFAVIATGYFDNPNYLGIPGEDLPKVSHYFKEAHPYQGMRVAIIGGNNSAVDAAMELERAGAQVTVIYRGETYSPKIKPWIRPVFESLVHKGRIGMLFNAHVEEILPEEIVVRRGEERFSLPNDAVFALTGYRPDHRFLKSMGVQFDADTGVPSYDEQTMETNVPNLFVSGVIAAGNEANVIFIENGRLHGRLIADAIRSRLAEHQGVFR